MATAIPNPISWLVCVYFKSDDETGDSPQPPPEYVCKRRRLHNLPVTYSSRDHEDGETPLGGGPPLSRRASTAASDADEEMVDYGEEFDVDCPDDLEMSSAKSPSKSRHTGRIRVGEEKGKG